MTDCESMQAGNITFIKLINTFHILCKNKFAFELSVTAYVVVSPVTPPGLSLNRAYNQARLLQHPNEITHDARLTLTLYNALLSKHKQSNICSKTFSIAPCQIYL